MTFLFRRYCSVFISMVYTLFHFLCLLDVIIIRSRLQLYRENQNYIAIPMSKFFLFSVIMRNLNPKGFWKKTKIQGFPTVFVFWPFQLISLKIVKKQDFQGKKNLDIKITSLNHQIPIWIHTKYNQKPFQWKKYEDFLC